MSDASISLIHRICLKSIEANTRRDDYKEFLNYYPGQQGYSGDYLLFVLWLVHQLGGRGRGLPLEYEHLDHIRDDAVRLFRDTYPVV